MERKSRFTKWGYEPVVLNTKAKEVFDNAFVKLNQQLRLLNIEPSETVVRVVYNEFGEIHYELSFLIGENRHEIIVSSVYEFDQEIFKFVMSLAK